MSFRICVLTAEEPDMQSASRYVRKEQTLHAGFHLRKPTRPAEQGLNVCIVVYLIADM